jgi:hypothetical protein
LIQHQVLPTLIVEKRPKRRGRGVSRGVIMTTRIIAITIGHKIQETWELGRILTCGRRIKSPNVERVRATLLASRPTTDNARKMGILRTVVVEEGSLGPNSQPVPEVTVVRMEGMPRVGPTLAMMVARGIKAR